jgi:glycosyltransferase involved in cell wall biosynthesis
VWSSPRISTERVGGKDLNIVILTEYDFSGNMYNLASFINKHTKHTALAIKHKNNPLLQYSTMIQATKNNLTEVREFIYKADVVVWKETATICSAFGLDVEKMKKKNNIIILGGGGYSSNRFFLENQWFYGELGAKWATSSLDFTKKNQDWAWIPASIRIDHLREKYDYTKMGDPLLFTSPSNATDKMMNVRGKFDFIVDQLRSRGLKFRAKTVFNEVNDVCLHLKAPADIFFDRIWDIYGMNSQEAAAFEAVVITGTSEYVRDKIKEFGYDCPFIFVDHHVLAIDEIEFLIENPDEMRRIGRECYRYVRKVHDGRVAVKNLMKLIKE